MTTTKKELSYFRLKLENYLSEHFPEMLSDKPFITARADEALQLTAMQWYRASRIPKQRQWQVKSYTKVCTFPSMTRLYLSWRMSLRKNCPPHSPKDCPRYF